MKLTARLRSRMRQSQSTRTGKYTVSGNLKSRQPQPVSLARSTENTGSTLADQVSELQHRDAKGDDRRQAEKVPEVRSGRTSLLP